MKKIRYLPFGYTIRNGHTVIEQQEADIVRNIFKAYIQGASLKEIAEDLTVKKIPYTERTCVWDKARISRILENAKYTGDEEFEMIIDEDIYEEAAAVKSARRWNQAVQESEGIRQIRDRVRCGQCGAPMLRHINSKRAIRESWTCSNTACGLRVRISDGELLQKVTLLMNRIIENADLLLPHEIVRRTDSPAVQELQQQITLGRKRLEAGQSAYHREASRLESLQNLAERYDGYGNSIRRVMERKGQEAGICGVVADLIQTDKRYETAIETALGGSIQNVVTEDEETAKRLIQYLKQNRYGRATFLPLTAIHGGQGFARAEALREPGVIGTADKLVTVEDKFTSLAEHLLGRTLVADNIDTGIRLARKYRQSLRIVTLEGDLINPGGAMSGGAFKNSSNLLSRRREIGELEKTVARLKTELQKSEAEVAAAKEKRTALYAKVEEIQQELQNDYVVQNTAKMNLDQVKSRQNVTRENSEGIYAERKKLEEQVHEIEENEESIKMELETSQQLEDELTRQMESSQKWLEKEREAEAAEVRKNENIHLSFAALEQKKDFIEENFVRIREEMGKFQEELATLNASKGENHGEIEQKEAQITEIRQTIENSKELFEEINKEIEESQKKREELNQKHKAFLKKREDLAAHMAELDKESFRLTSKKEGYEEALEKQINYMWEEYELTYNHALEIRDESLTDPAEMRRRIQELKTEIRKLGSVNVNAIEDFKNLSERYEFMKTQHDDLVEAEATLKKIIEELDEAMRKQFTEQFAKISQEFNQVFKQLFGGGKGTLELMDDEDVLEAGIRIIAQPPGKKLQNMMQLSGGEKALTAISLLFAIQNLKPSPFCLLDEIEAALDDSNVTRFAQYLHKLTKNTQFIVITHRRGTMTAADRLYGITMQEKGVSTLVSVDLLEDELTK